MKKDHYATLGVNKNISDDELKKAYRKLAMKYHPDRNNADPMAPTRMSDINEAYEVLGDAEKRAAYDQPPFAGFANARQAKRPNAGNFKDFDDFFKQHTGGRHDYEDLNHNFANARSGRPYNPWDQAESVTNPDKTIDLTITLEEAFTGGTKNVTYESDVVDWSPNGHTREKISVQVTIPPGIEQGQKLKCAGGGLRDNPSKQPGDLYLNISIARHDTFVRDGNDLIYMAKISVLDLILGTEIKVPTMEGSSLLVPVRAATQTHSKIRIPNRGMPKLKGSERGHLFIEFIPQVPDISQLTEEQQLQLAELNTSLKA